MGGCSGSHLDRPPQQWGFHLEDGMEERHAVSSSRGKHKPNQAIHDKPNSSYKSS